MATATESILRFWRDLEVFNVPKAPDLSERRQQPRTDISILDSEKPLPWHMPAYRDTDTHAWTHNVFVGTAQTEEIVELVLKAVLPEEALSERELNRMSGRTWMAAFAVDGKGVPIADSYTLASYVVGVERTLGDRSFDNISSDLQAAAEAFAERRHLTQTGCDKTAKGDTSSDTPRIVALAWSDLCAEITAVAARLGKAARDIGPGVIIKSVQRKKKKNTPDGAPEVEFLNSFYLDDLDRLIGQSSKRKHFGKGLSAFLGDPLSERSRVDALANPKLMTELADPARMPAGRWLSPTNQSLFLAQQSAVYEIASSLLNGKGILGVNGPPGTGKTTLLSDIIAEIVVDRAEKIAKQSNPWDIFERERQQIASSNLALLRADIVGKTGIVVASNNNAAVENISAELPARKKVSNEFAYASYLNDVAASVIAAQDIKDDDNKPIVTWGLIAAVLGNNTNRKSFCWGFFREDKKETEKDQIDQPKVDGSDPTNLEPLPDGKTPPSEPTYLSIKQVLEQSIEEGQRWKQEWTDAKVSFQIKLKTFKEIKAAREKAAKQLAESDQLLCQLAAAKKNLAQCEQQSADLAEELQAVRDDYVLAQAEHVAVDQRLATERTTGKPNWLIRFLQHQPFLWMAQRFGFKNETYRAWLSNLIRLQSTLDAAVHRLAELNASIRGIRDTIKNTDAKITGLRQQILDHSARLEAIRKVLDGLRAKGITLPDADYYALPPAKQHLAHLWVDKELEKLRSEIFIAALRLHEASIKANAKAFLSGLREVKRMLERSSREPLQPAEREHLWHYLFFVTPVVSTALASFSRLFEGMGQETLGWLLIDEAGQATPQSTAGAIWRATRTIIIGDPMQVEPVFTVPTALVKNFREKHGVDIIWSPAEESAQTLADRITKLGSWIGGKAKGKWTGLPLRAHIRCEDPMFSVANTIAYGEQMVQAKGNRTPIHCVLGESAWFDVSGTVADKQAVREEIAMLEQLVSLISRDWPTILPTDQERLEGKQEKPASVYIISPFKRVTWAIQEVLKRHKLKDRIKTGTVHTFQGREANVVFLVLGSAPGAAGKGSRDWVADTPNILNVALTRAKNRVYVIGSRSDWRKHPNFRTLDQGLPAPKMMNPGKLVTT